MEKQKRRFGDRKDGYLLRDLDSMHFITPLIYPNRCDNEAYIAETVDLTNINAFLAEKNAGNPTFKYTMFHLVVAALLKTIVLRPKLNRFIANKNTYQRNEVSAAFVVKKILSDTGEEALAFLHAKPDDTLETIHNEIHRQVTTCRSDRKIYKSVSAGNEPHCPTSLYYRQKHPQYHYYHACSDKRYIEHRINAYIVFIQDHSDRRHKWLRYKIGVIIDAGLRELLRK